MPSEDRPIVSGASRTLDRADLVLVEYLGRDRVEQGPGCLPELAEIFAKPQIESLYSLLKTLIVSGVMFSP